MRRRTALLAAALVLYGTDVAAETWNRLSDQVRRDPARAAARMLGVQGLFTYGVLSADQAFFYSHPTPAADATDLCSADVLVVQLDKGFRPTGFRTLRSFQAMGVRANGGARPSPRTCDAFDDASSFFWAPSGRLAAQALGGFQVAVTAAQAGAALPFTLECGPRAEGCAKDPRSALARMAGGSVVDVSARACEAGQPCLVVEVHAGNADAGEVLRFVLEGGAAPTRIRIEETGSWIADNFTAR